LPDAAWVADTDVPTGPGEGDNGVGSPPTPWWRRWWVWAAAAALVLVAGVAIWAVQDDDNGEDAAPSMTSTPTSTTTTTTTTTTTSPTTTAPVPEVVLKPDGLGPVTIGVDGDDAVAQLSGLIGPPDQDATYDCGEVYGVHRYVVWGDLSIQINPAEPGIFIFYTLEDEGRVSAPSPTSEPLATAEGITVGSTLGDIRDAYGPNVEVSASQVTGLYEFRLTGPWAVPGDWGLWGELSGPDPSDLVQNIRGGTPTCFA